jgi:hypothetical protein
MGSFSGHLTNAESDHIPSFSHPYRSSYCSSQKISPAHSEYLVSDASANVMAENPAEVSERVAAWKLTSLFRHGVEIRSVSWAISPRFKLIVPNVLSLAATL